MRTVTSNQLTAVMLSSNFNEKIKEFIASDQVFTFMNSILREYQRIGKSFCLMF